MDKIKSGKSMTYDEIGEKMKISPQQVHKIEREAFNKIIRSFMEKNNENIFTTIVNISEYFGIDSDQCLKKLDKVNTDILNEFVEKNYGRKTK